MLCITKWHFFWLTFGFKDRFEAIEISGPLKSEVSARCWWMKHQEEGQRSRELCFACVGHSIEDIAECRWPLNLYGGACVFSVNGPLATCTLRAACWLPGTLSLPTR